MHCDNYTVAIYLANEPGSMSYQTVLLPISEFNVQYYKHKDGRYEGPGK